MDTGGTLTEVRKTTIKANGYFQWRMLPPLTVPKESHGGWGGGEAVKITQVRFTLMKLIYQTCNIAAKRQVQINFPF